MCSCWQTRSTSGQIWKRYGTVTRWPAMSIAVISNGVTTLEGLASGETLYFAPDSKLVVVGPFLSDQVDLVPVMTAFEKKLFGD